MGSRHNWTRAEEESLLNIIEDKLAKCRSYGRFCSGVISEFAHALNSLHPTSNLQLSHVQRKLRWFRDTYNSINNVLSTDGFVWDGSNKCVKGDTAAWNDYIQGGSEKWRDKVYPLYDRLHTIFGAPCNVEHNEHNVELRDVSDISSAGDKWKYSSTVFSITCSH